MAFIDSEFEQNRQYEGPPVLLYERTTLANIFDPKGMIGRISVAQRLTKEYGPEGTGWGIWKTRYIAENALKDHLHAEETGPAREALTNLFSYGKYESNDGTDMTGRAPYYVRDPDMVDVVIYPDGKVHAANNQ